MIKFFKKIIIATLAFSPLISFAQYDFDSTDSTRYYGSYGGSEGFWNLFYIVRDILDQVIILLIAFAVVFFLYGIVKYIGSTDDEENRSKAKSIMIYGIIGLFVMVSFWGIVNILVVTFQLNPYPVIDIPYLDLGDGGDSGGSSSGGSFDY